VILADTSVWIDHLRSGADSLVDLLNRGQILVHPLIVGEIAMGSLRQRALVIRTLQQLPYASSATDSEVLQLIENERLFGSGIGYSDAHLLASVRLTTGSSLWTRDRRLRDVAKRLSLAAAVI
jgi:predicted nucleic acid-binding protein